MGMPIAALRMRNASSGLSSSIVLRSTSISSGTSSGSATTTVSFPAGAAAGDQCIILAASGDSYFLPSGWASVQDNTPATGWICQTFKKVLTAADITAGSVTFNKNPAGGGTFAGWLVAYCFTGGASVRSLKLVSSITSGSVNGQSFSFPATLGAGDIVVMCATGRGNAAPGTISPGTSDQSTFGSTGNIQAYHYVMPAAGSGSFAVTGIVSLYEYVFMAVALKDAGPPTFSVASSMTSANGFYAEGDTITGVPGTHDGNGGSTYKWTKDGVDIPGATSLTYTLPVGFSTHDLAFVTIGANDGATTNSASAPHTIGTPTYGSAGNRKTSDGNDRLTSTGDTRVITIRTA